MPLWVHLIRMTLGGAGALFAASAVAGPTAHSQTPSRVFSLDQCADQYVRALADPSEIVGLSHRALDADSYLRAEMAGFPERRATSESVLAARPTLVVRYWGGDARLLADLRRRGVRVVEIADATDFPAVRADVRAVAAALGAPARGEALIAAMDRRLTLARGAWNGKGAVYLTSGGDTAGPGTLMGAMLRAAGLANLTRAPGFSTLSLESLVLSPPAALVLGFFDPALDAWQHWSLGRARPLRRLAAGRTIVSLPAAVLTCPAWFTANGALAIARAGPARMAGA